MGRPILLGSLKEALFRHIASERFGKIAKTSLTIFKRFDIIDGQQRLTTILILLREIISQLKAISASDLKDEVEALEKSYLKDGGHYKLNPLGTDGEFFHHVIIDDNKFLEDDSSTPSQRRLADAKTFFRQQLVQEEKRQPSAYQAFLVQLKQKVDDLQVIQYQVTSDADAIRIFETVNDRGRPLSNLEKTKSFLMHTSYLGMEDEDAVAERLEELNSHFTGMYRHFDDVSGTKHMERLRLTENDVQRYHFINYISPGDDSSRPLDSLKDNVRDMLKKDQNSSVEYALEYTKDLERSFFAVKCITDSFRNDSEGGMLSKVFMSERMGNIFPLLIASWLRFSEVPERIESILRLMEVFIVRVYLVGGSRSDTGESWFNRTANGVHQGHLGYDELVDELNNMILNYQNDDRFRRNLAQEDVYNEFGSRPIKYLLSEYEVHLRKESDTSLALSTQEEILTAKYEVEHIWAQNPSARIQGVEETQYEQHLHRLGNLTIASQSWNSSMGNKPFEEKRSQPKRKPSYANSSLLVQKELAKRRTWNVAAINKREKKIIEFSMQRWSL